LWVIERWLPTQNNRHGEVLSGPVAKADEEVVSSENPTADTAMRRFNFIWVTSRLTCEGTDGRISMVTGHGSPTIVGCNLFRLTTEPKLKPMQLSGRRVAPRIRANDRNRPTSQVGAKFRIVVSENQGGLNRSLREILQGIVWIGKHKRAYRTWPMSQPKGVA
jgi:hypothetical protein